MPFVLALVVLAALLSATVTVGVYLQWMQRRPRPALAHEIIQPERLGAVALGETATLLQFSTDHCARCPGVHRTLAAVADTHEGVRHLDIDLTDRPDIAKHFHVMQTPTTLVLDSDGAIQTRFGGIPSRDVVELELARVTGASQSLPEPVERG